MNIKTKIIDSIKNKVALLIKPKTSNNIMHYSIENYIDIIQKVFEFPKSQSDFWIVVIKITWFMIASEKDPVFFIQQLEELKSEESNGINKTAT